MLIQSLLQMLGAAPGRGSMLASERSLLDLLHLDIFPLLHSQPIARHRIFFIFHTKLASSTCSKIDFVANVLFHTHRRLRNEATIELREHIVQGNFPIVARSLNGVCQSANILDLCSWAC